MWLAQLQVTTGTSREMKDDYVKHIWYFAKGMISWEKWNQLGEAIMGFAQI